MAALVKCNTLDVPHGDEFAVSLPRDKSLQVAPGDEVFVWTSEKPRSKPNGRGLEMRGELLSVSVSAQRATGRIRVSERLTGRCFTMYALALLARESEPARYLHSRIARFRHRRIWMLSPTERQLLDDVFSISESGDFQRSTL